jgi:RNA polymerase sigma-70 factor, ECF subfamily
MLAPMTFIAQLPGASSRRPPSAQGAEPALGPDAESRAWVDDLAGDGPRRERAIEALHALLLRAARFEVDRRRAAISLPRSDHDDLAQQSADDALVAILGKLGDFRGESRFTTWAYKFALLEAASKVRRRAWQEREVPLAAEGLALIADDRSTPQRDAETSELYAALRVAIHRDLSRHQRDVLVATTLNDVPIDVLAERLETTRGALYKTVHDARLKLRAALAGCGVGIDEYMETAGQTER